MNIGGFSDAVFNVISAFLADNNQRFVGEVEAIEPQNVADRFSEAQAFCGRNGPNGP